MTRAALLLSTIAAHSTTYPTLPPTLPKDVVSLDHGACRRSVEG